MATSPVYSLPDGQAERCVLFAGIRFSRSSASFDFGGANPGDIFPAGLHLILYHFGKSKNLLQYGSYISSFNTYHYKLYY